MINATVNEIANWLKSNQHRFVFFVYNTGSGGEFIHSYLSKQPNLLFHYNEVPDGHGNNNTNRIATTVPNISKSIQQYSRHGNNTAHATFEALAEALVKSDTPITNTDINVFEKHNSLLMLLTHEAKQWMSLFKKSKFIFYLDDEYENYIDILGSLKCLEDEGDGILTNFKKLGPPSANLKQDLINAIVYTNWRWEVVKTYSNKDIENTLDSVIRKNLPFIKSTRYKNYNIRYVKFCESFTGTWINDEFNIDSKEFNKAIIEWDKNNTAFLQTMNAPKFIGKQPNRYLYNV